MSLTTKLIEWAMKLPPATHSDLRCEADLRVPMPDGTVLLANRTAPSDQVIVLGDANEMKRHFGTRYMNQRARKPGLDVVERRALTASTNRRAHRT
jgi:hypothetical protein